VVEASISRQSAHKCRKDVSPTHQLPLPPQEIYKFSTNVKLAFISMNTQDCKTHWFNASPFWRTIKSHIISFHLQINFLLVMGTGN